MLWSSALWCSAVSYVDANVAAESTLSIFRIDGHELWGVVKPPKIDNSPYVNFSFLNKFHLKRFKSNAI